MNQFTSNEQNNSQESFESVCKKFQNRFEAITSSTVNPSTITTFYEDALHRLISLTEDVVHTYVSVDGSKLQGKELEDEAMAHYGLTSVSETLTIIGERMEYLSDLKECLAQAASLSPEVFVPPNPEDKYLVTGSGKGLEVKQLIPRLLTLGYILEHDLGLSVSDTEEVAFVQGEITDTMMRKHPYIRVSINPLNRIVYLCDEEGNASFVFDKEKVLEKVGKVELLDVMEKFRYKEMIVHDPACGDVLRYGTQWRKNMNALLTASFEASKSKTNNEQEKNNDMVAVSSDLKKIIPKKKEGWESIKFFASKVIGGRRALKRYFEDYKKNNKRELKADYPEWFELQKPVFGPSTEYLHPDLVAKIIEDLGLLDSVPKKKEGWESASSLSEKKVIASDRKIRKFSEGFKKEHPEWFESQKPESGGAVEHYHPDLVEKILKNFHLRDSFPKKKEGWESSYFLGKKVIGGSRVVRNYAEKFRLEHPEWFQTQLPTKGSPSEYYHPELILKIISEITKDQRKHDSFPSKMTGWESASSLDSKVFGGRNAIIDYAEKFRLDHSEWFDKQRDFNHIVECYHPDLVAKIIKELGLNDLIPKKKEGWETSNSLFKKITKSPEKIDEYAQTFKEVHPEWFEKQRSAAYIVEHYHPDLVAKILERFPKKEN